MRMRVVLLPRRGRIQAREADACVSSTPVSRRRVTSRPTPNGRRHALEEHLCAGGLASPPTAGLLGECRRCVSLLVPGRTLYETKNSHARPPSRHRLQQRRRRGANERPALFPPFLQAAGSPGVLMPPARGTAIMLRAMIGSFALSAATLFGGSALVTSVVRTAVRLRRVRLLAAVCVARACSRAVVTRRVRLRAQKASAPPCSECRGERRVPCATCDGAFPSGHARFLVAHLHDPVTAPPCALPVRL